jgi:hypothetical protein
VWIEDMKRNRRSMNIFGLTRISHHVAAFLDENNEVVTGYVTEEIAVTQHDIYASGKRNFWRGACLG